MQKSEPHAAVSTSTPGARPATVSRTNWEGKRFKNEDEHPVEERHEVGRRRRTPLTIYDSARLGAGEDADGSPFGGGLQWGQPTQPRVGGESNLKPSRSCLKAIERRARL